MPKIDVRQYEAGEAWARRTMADKVARGDLPNLGGRFPWPPRYLAAYAVAAAATRRLYLTDSKAPLVRREANLNVRDYSFWMGVLDAANEEKVATAPGPGPEGLHGAGPALLPLPQGCSATMLPSAEAAARGRRAADFDPEQLRIGMNVALEHVGGLGASRRGRCIAVRIAADHLTEDPHYYVKLRKAEL
jgi:hypothetical protein